MELNARGGVKGGGSREKKIKKETKEIRAWTGQKQLEAEGLTHEHVFHIARPRVDQTSSDGSHNEKPG